MSAIVESLRAFSRKSTNITVSFYLSTNDTLLYSHRFRYTGLFVIEATTNDFNQVISADIRNALHERGLN